MVETDPHCLPCPPRRGWQEERCAWAVARGKRLATGFHLGPGFPGPRGQTAPPPSHMTTLAGPWEFSFRLFPGPSLMGDLSLTWATGVGHPLPWRVCAHSGASGRPRRSAHLRFPPAWLRAVSKGPRGDGGEAACKPSEFPPLHWREREVAIMSPRLFVSFHVAPSLR